MTALVATLGLSLRSPALDIVVAELSSPHIGVFGHHYLLNPNSLSTLVDAIIAWNTSQPSGSFSTAMYPIKRP